ncbi:oligosaccharide flippase family protein [Kluyvera cryocrescens]|uniref:oligosaccharide flippase family protein n=1 Tax=Kluyvera cryocrescens TaxID=580 RepID=UPI0039F6C09F
MKLIRDSAIYISGELLSRSIPFILLPYLTRRLGVDGFGQMSYYQTILALFAIIIGLSQDGAVTRYFYFYGKRAINLIVTTGYIYTFAISTILLLYCYIFDSKILSIIVLASTFQSLLNTQLSIRQCQKLVKQYVLIQIISAVSTGLLTWLLLAFSSNALVEKRFIALLLGNMFCVFIAYFIYANGKKIKYKYKISLYKKAAMYLLGFGIPLIFHQASGFLKGQLDRLLIYHNFSAGDLGIYAAAFQIASIFSILLMAVNKAGVPYYYEAIKNKKIDLIKLRKMCFLSLAIVPMPALFALVLPSAVWGVILGSAFYGVKYYICLFLVGMGFVIPYLILVNYLFFHGRNKEITLCSTISAVFYCAALYLFSTIGMRYVPYAMILSNIIIIPLLFYFCGRVNKQTMETK